MADEPTGRPTLRPGDRIVATRRGFALRKGETAAFVEYTTGPTGDAYMTVRLDSLGIEVGYPVGSFKAVP